jgi:hypothetical protein
MGSSVQDLRDLLKLAATLRGFAAEAYHADYACKLLRAAIELELRADFLAGHRASDVSSDQEQALHAPIDLRI